MNMNRTGGDYRPQGVILTSKLAVVAYQNGNTNGQAQTFFIRKDNNYVERQTGQLIEKQPLDIQCTTFEPAVIQALATIEPGAKVNLVGWLEPSWRGYVADNSPEGDKFVIPDAGRDAIISPKGRTINPDPHPYRIMDKPNVYVFDAKQVRVTELTVANAVATESVETTADAWSTATADTDAAQPATNDAAALAAAKKEAEEAQAKLDALTAGANPDAPVAAAPASFTELN